MFIYKHSILHGAMLWACNLGVGGSDFQCFCKQQEVILSIAFNEQATVSFEGIFSMLLIII